ncbi:MAG: hypothetical protein AAF942_00085 [Pseudomonadota bacterium]
MAIVIESKASNTVDGSADLTITKPPGTVANDVLVAWVGSDSFTASSWSPPDGTWTEVDFASYGIGDGGELSCYYKVAGASEPTSYTFNDDAADDDKAGVIYRLSGVDTTTPVDVFAVFVEKTGSNPTNDSVTTTVANCLVFIGIADPSGDSESATEPSGWTLQDQLSDGGVGDCALAVASKFQVTAGATGSAQWTSASDDYGVGTVAFRPAPGAVDAAASLSGSASLAADGIAFGVRDAAASLSGAATLTANGVVPSSGSGPAIKVQRGTNAIGNAGGTDTTFTAVASLSAAFEFNSNNRFSHGGDDNQTASNREGDDMSGTVELTGTGTLTFTRESGSLASNTRFAWQIAEYLGAPGGDNEFIVRSRNTVSLNGASSATQALDNSVTNIDDCICFITGVRTNATADDWDDCNVLADLSDSSTLRIQRGATANNVTVQVVVVEFTGANWTVLHGQDTGHTADSGTITLNTQMDGLGATGDVLDWATAAIFGQLRGNANANTDDSIADTSQRYTPGAGTTTVNWAFDANQAAASNKATRVYVLKHADLAVTRYQDTQNLGSAMNVDITSAGLTDLERAMVVASRTSSGTGTAYGRGWVNARLTSLTNVELWVHRSGNTINTEIQVVDFAAVVDAAAGPVDAAASLTANGTVQASGNRAANALSALSSSGTLTADGGIVVDGASLLAGAGTLSATGAADRAGAAALNGSSTVAAFGGAIRPAAMAVTASATMTAVPAVTVVSSAALQGSGTLTAAAEVGQAVVEGAASLVASGALTAAGLAIRAAASTLQGSAAVSGSAVAVRGGQAALSGAAALAPSPAVLRPASVSLTATAFVAANATVQGEVLGAVALAGTGALSASPVALFAGGATLAGSATLAASGGLISPATAILSGSAALAAAARLIAAGNASLGGTASLSAVAEVVRNSQIVLQGTAALTAAGTSSGEVTGAAALSGSASMAPNAERVADAAAPLSAGAALAIDGQAVRNSSAALGGAASLAAAADVTAAPVNAAASLTSSAALSAVAAAELAGAISLTGSAELAATLVKISRTPISVTSRRPSLAQSTRLPDSAVAVRDAGRSTPSRTNQSAHTNRRPRRTYDT